jgi:hypothetical protein
LAGECEARRELGDVADPVAGLGVADAQPFGDYLVDGAADVGGVFLGQACDHVVADATCWRREVFICSSGCSRTVGARLWRFGSPMAATAVCRASSLAVTSAGTSIEHMF